MMQEDIKKLDKKLRLVKDPFGTGFSHLHKILQETADRYGMTKVELLQLHLMWRKGHK